MVLKAINAINLKEYILLLPWIAFFFAIVGEFLNSERSQECLSGGTMEPDVPILFVSWWI